MNNNFDKETTKQIAEYNLACYEYDVVSRVKMWKDININHRMTSEEMFKYAELKKQVEQLGGKLNH